MVSRVKLVKDLSRAIRGGHPWVYSAALSAPDGLAPGALVDVVDARGQLVASGFFDPVGPIGVRVLSIDEAAGAAASVRRKAHPPDPSFAGVGTSVVEDWLQARVRSACAIRTAAGIASDAVRLLHGEGDFVPGLVIDRYATTGVVRFDGAAAAAFWRPRIETVAAACAAAGFAMDRIWARPVERGGEGEAIRGGPPPATVEIREGAARYLVDVVHGQKTGFFLDQRDNRAAVARLAAGAEVLNLFAYTGGFSIAAALAGARRTTTVDQAAPAIDAAAANFAANGLATGRAGGGARGAPHELVVADVFDFLRDAATLSRRWDIVICDPPSFAPRAQALPKALAAYRELNRAAAAAVAPGGLLATASCSSHVTPADFQAAVTSGLQAAGRIDGARLIEVRGAGPDHPVTPAFPEGRYLKFLLIALP